MNWTSDWSTTRPSGDPGQVPVFTPWVVSVDDGDAGNPLRLPHEEKSRGLLGTRTSRLEVGSGLTDEMRAVRTVIEISVPTLNSVLQEGDGLLCADDLTFECGYLRPHNRLRCPFLRCHGSNDFWQREADAPQLQHRARLLHSVVVVKAVAVAIAAHGECPYIFPVPQHVSFDAEFCGCFSDRLHHTRLAFMST